MSDSAWLNGDNEALSLADRGLAYGDGFYTTMRLNDGVIEAWSLHQRRLLDAALMMGMATRLTFAEWFQPHKQFIESKALALQQGVIKVMVTRGHGGRGYAPPMQAQLQCIVSHHQVPQHYNHWREQGVALRVHAMTLSRHTMLAGVKHLNRIEQVMLKHNHNGAGDDYVVCDDSGKLVCGSAANLFFAKGRRLVTPALGRSGIAGITRLQIMQAMVAQGYQVIATELSVTDINAFDGAIMCNALMGVVAINSIDQVRFDSHSLQRTMEHALNKRKDDLCLND
ncbi:aminodeoxychorismate lyase [Paraferrimonas haliotis]|uniref:Aminodeoxychorismate lyase n=1 Tax=Paraferrimonas haliotis TaxID=2013866 RepID=A0AA37TSF7_9GAMM|nr:aminodeoxychorismate lyase [Paraferrimonas haliotis]GLS84645.1 4-amino-4-deoxychorismate lyase [Paraferrimonas haliotis]